MGCLLLYLSADTIQSICLNFPETVAQQVFIQTNCYINFFLFEFWLLITELLKSILNASWLDFLNFSRISKIGIFTLLDN